MADCVLISGIVSAKRVVRGLNGFAVMNEHRFISTSERGAFIVLFAIVSIAAFALIVLAINFGGMVVAKNQLRQSAESGARAAAEYLAANQLPPNATKTDYDSWLTAARTRAVEVVGQNVVLGLSQVASAEKDLSDKTYGTMSVGKFIPDEDSDVGNECNAPCFISKSEFAKGPAPDQVNAVALELYSENSLPMKLFLGGGKSPLRVEKAVAVIPSSIYAIAADMSNSIVQGSRDTLKEPFAITLQTPFCPGPGNPSALPSACTDEAGVSGDTKTKCLTTFWGSSSASSHEYILKDMTATGSGVSQDDYSCYRVTFPYPWPPNRYYMIDKTNRAEPLYSVLEATKSFAEILDGERKAGEGLAALFFDWTRLSPREFPTMYPGSAAYTEFLKLFDWSVAANRDKAIIEHIMFPDFESNTHFGTAAAGAMRLLGQGGQKPLSFLSVIVLSDFIFSCTGDKEEGMCGVPGSINSSLIAGNIRKNAKKGIEYWADEFRRNNIVVHSILFNSSDDPINNPRGSVPGFPLYPKSDGSGCYWNYADFVSDPANKDKPFSMMEPKDTDATANFYSQFQGTPKNYFEPNVFADIAPKKTGGMSFRVMPGCKAGNGVTADKVKEHLDGLCKSGTPGTPITIESGSTRYWSLKLSDGTNLMTCDPSGGTLKDQLLSAFNKIREEQVSVVLAYVKEFK